MRYARLIDQKWVLSEIRERRNEVDAQVKLDVVNHVITTHTRVFHIVDPPLVLHLQHPTPNTLLVRRNSNMPEPEPSSQPSKNALKKSRK
jgi:hypothetical protein